MVLEVGGGLGVLSEYLAPRVGHLHVVEVDRTLEPALRDALAPFDNATLHLADAVQLDFAALDPAPDKVVANLPYGVAATVDPEVDRGAARRDAVGRRWCSARWGSGWPPRPGSKTYGATSVIAQLSCDVRVLRRVPAPSSTRRRTSCPRSCCCAASRRRPPPRVVALVHAAFAHRRKALAGRWRSRPAAAPEVRDRARAGARRARPPARRPRRAARARRLRPAGRALGWDAPPAGGHVRR